jgi:polar amino acid transport system substrate-binding protein
MLKKISLFLLAISMISVGSIATAETITFAVGEWAPYVSEKLPGYGDHAIKITEAYKKAGIDVKFKFMNWNRAYEMVKSGKEMGSFSWYKTPEREGEVAFANKHTEQTISHIYFLKSKFPNGIEAKSLEDLAKQKVKFVGIASYWYDKPLKEMKADAKMLGKEEMVWKTIKAGRADVFIEVKEVAAAGMDKFLGGDKSLIGMSKEPIQIKEMFPIFAKSNPAAQKALEAWDANAK